MYPNRAVVALRLSSRQQCSRQIHSTALQRAEQAAAAAAGAAAPRRRAGGRKERSTFISNEVSRLQQGPPAPAQQQPSSAVDAPSPSSPSASASAAGRMGQNEPAEREGLAAQGIARRTASTTMEPNQGGADVLSASAPGRGRVAVRGRKSSGLPKAAGRAYVPVGFGKKELLRSGGGTATIAGGNFAGVVEDRVHFVVEPGRRVGGGVTKAQDGQKLAQGQMVRVQRDPKRAGPMGKNSLLREETRQVVVGKLVQGRFDARGLLDGKKKQGPLDEIKKRLLLNGTYLGADASKLVEKVQGFLTKEQWKKVQLAGGR